MTIGSIYHNNADPRFGDGLVKPFRLFRQSVTILYHTPVALVPNAPRWKQVSARVAAIAVCLILMLFTAPFAIVGCLVRALDKRRTFTAPYIPRPAPVAAPVPPIDIGPLQFPTQSQMAAVTTTNTSGLSRLLKVDDLAQLLLTYMDEKDAAQFTFVNRQCREYVWKARDSSAPFSTHDTNKRFLCPALAERFWGIDGLRLYGMYCKVNPAHIPQWRDVEERSAWDLRLQLALYDKYKKKVSNKNWSVLQLIARMMSGAFVAFNALPRLKTKNRDEILSTPLPHPVSLYLDTLDIVIALKLNLAFSDKSQRFFTLIISSDETRHVSMKKMNGEEFKNLPTFSDRYDCFVVSLLNDLSSLLNDKSEEYVKSKEEYYKWFDGTLSSSGEQLTCTNITLDCSGAIESRVEEIKDEDQ